jgi:nucleotide-binding universal stress UspA family protein
MNGAAMNDPEMTIASVDSPTKILVPVDFSGRSKVGLAYAGMLAQCFGSSLVVVSNLNAPEQEVLDHFAKAEGLAIDDAARMQLESLARDVAPDIESSAVATYFDSPAEGILTTAEKNDVDLIVIASHGRGGMSRWLLGSVAEKIARSSEVPVIIVPARGDDS